MASGIRRKINITSHARMRFQERFPSLSVRDLPALASRARYNGYKDNCFKGEFRKYLALTTKVDNSGQVRIFQNKIFVFGGNGGHSRTLLTLYSVPDKFNNYKDYLKGESQTG